MACQLDRRQRPDDERKLRCARACDEHDAAWRAGQLDDQQELHKLVRGDGSADALCRGGYGATPQRQHDGDLTHVLRWRDRAVETRSPGPGNQDVVSYTYYDPMGRVVFTSNPYYVIAYTGQSGPSAFATPDASQPGASTTYTNQRTSSVTDALGHTTQTLVDVTCNPMTGDSGCYVRTRTVDALAIRRPPSPTRGDAPITRGPTQGRSPAASRPMPPPPIPTTPMGT